MGRQLCTLHFQQKESTVLAIVCTAKLGDPAILLSWTLLGTPTERHVSKHQFSKRPISKRLVSKRQVYKTLGIQNIMFQNVRFQNVNRDKSLKTSGF